MIIEDYIRNPYGKGISLMSSDIRTSLDNIYESLKDGIELKWYKVSNQYMIAHVKVPSRSVKTLKYDVVIEFDLSTLEEGRNTINRAKAKVFSNCPSFTYTFAYTFNTKGELCEWARSKYDPEVLSREPKQRNPYLLTGYERSLYLSIKHILSGRNNIKLIDLIAVKINNFNYILSSIKSQTEIERLYKDGKEKQREDEKNKHTEKQSPKSIQHKAQYHRPGVTKTATTAKTTKNTNKTPVTSKTMKTKKI